MANILNSFLENEAFMNAYNIVRAFFIVADIILLVLFVYAFTKLWKFRAHFHIESHGHKKNPGLKTKLFTKHWQVILKKASLEQPDSMRLALIEADSLADHVLKDMGLKGEHMADRLMKLNPDEVKTLNRLWKAHKLRNDLVHTPGAVISPQEAKGALQDYQAFFKEVGALS